MCKREALSNNYFDEFLESAKNVLNDSDKKVSKLKISLFSTLFLGCLNKIHAIKLC